MTETTTKPEHWSTYPEVIDQEGDDMAGMHWGQRLQITLPFAEGKRLVVKRTRGEAGGRAAWHIADGQALSGDLLRLLALAIELGSQQLEGGRCE